MPAGPLRDGASEPTRRRMRRLGVTEVRLAPCGAVRSLRTQQRAWAFPSSDTRSCCSRAAVLDVSDRRSGLLVSVPPLSSITA